MTQLCGNPPECHYHNPKDWFQTGNEAYLPLVLQATAVLAGLRPHPEADAAPSTRKLTRRFSLSILDLRRPEVSSSGAT